MFIKQTGLPRPSIKFVPAEIIMNDTHLQITKEGISQLIPLEDVVKVEEMRSAFRSKDWELKFALILTYKYVRVREQREREQREQREQREHCCDDMCHIRARNAAVHIHDKASFRKSMNLVDSMDQRVEHVTLAAESQEEQQWWIKAICMNKGMDKKKYLFIIIPS